MRLLLWHIGTMLDMLGTWQSAWRQVSNSHELDNGLEANNPSTTLKANKKGQAHRADPFGLPFISPLHRILLLQRSVKQPAVNRVLGNAERLLNVHSEL